ncbi:STM4504/CBY_0614 family protein [Shewanella frigidimarina]|uniref:STM4504/CBY_0614 family protein n=1 Tax=Shewanella frigidimarina TaxID=56812 RepID=UPI003D7ADC94
MPIFELYSSRNKNVYPDIYQYQSPSKKLRVQIVKVICDSIGMKQGSSGYPSSSHVLYMHLFDLISKEYGEMSIHGYNSGGINWISEFFLNETSVDRFLDLLELLCTMLRTEVLGNFFEYQHSSGAKQNPNDAIDEINERMKRDGFGYEYLDGIIIRVDQDFIHNEVTKPALYMLSKFDGARSEFLVAHEHYRHSRFEECLVECNKSLESLLKNICDNEGWEYSKGTVNALIPICMNKGLIPSYLQTQLSSISTLISQGVSSIRNNVAHGIGTEIRQIPEHLVSYTLHLTASNIVFLSESYQHYLVNKS